MTVVTEPGERTMRCYGMFRIITTVIVATAVSGTAAASSTVTPSASTVTAGGQIIFTVVNDPSPTPLDWLGLYQTSAPDVGYVAWQFMNGMMTAPADRSHRRHAALFSAADAGHLRGAVLQQQHLHAVGDEQHSDGDRLDRERDSRRGDGVGREPQSASWWPGGRATRPTGWACIGYRRGTLRTSRGSF